VAQSREEGVVAHTSSEGYRVRELRDEEEHAYFRHPLNLVGRSGAREDELAARAGRPHTGLRVPL